MSQRQTVPFAGEREKLNTASMYEYEISKIILALWIGLNLTYDR
jgi:hypothetical protein